MRALTVWQPWASAIIHGPKRVENRPWRPASVRAGEPTWIAIHAGAKADARFRDRHEVEALLELWPGYRPSLPRGVVLGAARVVAAVSINDHDPADQWASGPFCWQIDDVFALPTPIAAKGAQGLWRLPPPIVDALRDAYRARA